jgi:hypothetical protein
MKKKKMLQRSPVYLAYTGIALIILIAISFLITVIYEWLVPPTDMHLLGLLSAALFFYLGPLACVLLLLAVIAKIWLSFINRKNSSHKDS